MAWRGMAPVSGLRMGDNRILSQGSIALLLKSRHVRMILDVKHALSLLSDGVHVRLEGAGHGLELGTWKVTLLLRAVTSFLESL